MAAMANKGDYILALDVGDKRIGVALAHRVARLPRPLTTLMHTKDVNEEITRLVREQHEGLVLVGLPRGMDGGYTDQNRATEAFSHKLAGVLPVPVRLADETLTSVQAEADLRTVAHTKAEVDALAACYILEGFLREHPGGLL
jgi:putative Holliday junction resolvase